MPHLFSFATNYQHNDGDASPQQELDRSEDTSSNKRPRRPSSMLKNALSSFRKTHGEPSEPPPIPATAPTELDNVPEYFPPLRRPSLPEHAAARRVVASLPRPQTFRRRESERREKLLEVEPSSNERRTLSADRRRSRGASVSAQALSPVPMPSLSTSLIPSSTEFHSVPRDEFEPTTSHGNPCKRSTKDLAPLAIPPASENDQPIDSNGECVDSALDRTSLQEEFERRWILNLSMHFRDKSNREKFFVTYAERPNQWRRITVSLDYRNAPEDSLEADLSTLHFQRDKSMRIYEAIRDSLSDIQYYDTVTNLKLETTPEDGQLHVHVREDANEIIQYPSISLFNHISRPRFNESALEFDSHLSGFVYKVRLAGRVVIKKEIPGPDTVDEFLYEVNALDALLRSDNVVQLEGIVTDDRGELVKALLISYASQGALVDMIYEHRGTSQLSWHRRAKWAKQIVNGLADIHENGFVQGDFTLSNIVIDDDDNAQIIDINRRGCPVGWEPPELGKLINSGQRIGMCIGVKTDLFQLGMVLWALAEEVDEPERVERPLPDVYEEVPDYFREIVGICLSEWPQQRLGAKQLLQLFPANAGPTFSSAPSLVNFNTDKYFSGCSNSTSTHRSAKEYIDPKLAMTIDEVKDHRREGSDPRQYEPDQVTYVNPDSNAASSTYRFESSGSWIIGRRSRGRSPVSSRRRRSSPYGNKSVSSATSLSDVSPMRRERSYCFDEKECLHHDPTQLDVASNDVAEQRPELPLVNRRLLRTQTEVSGLVADLVHTDSGFDETIDPVFGLESSCLAESPHVQRRKVYVPEDEDEGRGEQEKGSSFIVPVRNASPDQAAFLSTTGLVGGDQEERECYESTN